MSISHLEKNLIRGMKGTLNEPADIPRAALGVRDRVARLRAIGNGQVPLCAAVAWRLLARRALGAIRGDD